MRSEPFLLGARSNACFRVLNCDAGITLNGFAVTSPSIVSRGAPDQHHGCRPNASVELLSIELTVHDRITSKDWLGFLGALALGRHDAPGFILQFVELVVVAGLEIKVALFATFHVLVAEPERGAGRRVDELVALQHELLRHHLHMHRTASPVRVLRISHNSARWPLGLLVPSARLRIRPITNRDNAAGGIVFRSPDIFASRRKIAPIANLTASNVNEFSKANGRHGLVPAAFRDQLTSGTSGGWRWRAPRSFDHWQNRRKRCSPVFFLRLDAVV